jgi:hypothetical protein
MAGPDGSFIRANGTEHAEVSLHFSLRPSHTPFQFSERLKACARQALDWATLGNTRWLAGMARVARSSQEPAESRT